MIIFQSYEPELKSKSTQTVEPLVKTVSIGTWANIEDPALEVRKKVDMKTTSTQTIKEQEVVYNIYGMPWKVDLDHRYAESIATQTCSTEYQLSANYKTLSEDVEMMSEEEGIDTRDDLNRDPDWKPNENQQTPEERVLNEDVDGDEEVMEEEENVTPVSDKKYMVFGSQLSELLKFCPHCGSLVMERVMATKGSMLTVQMVCSQSHHMKWRSQPVINYYPLGNVLLSAACLFAEATYNRFHQICEFVGLQVPKPGTFFKHQQNLLFPVIAGTWKKTKQEIITEMSSREEDITLIGDGRCDSPGYSAKYGTYTVMDAATSKIAEFEVVQVTEVMTFLIYTSTSNEIELYLDTVIT